MDNENKIVQGGKGVILCLLFYISFYAIARGIQKLLLLEEAEWFIFSAAQRLAFGIFEMWLFVRIYNRNSWRDVLNTRGMKSAFAAGWAILLTIAAKSVTIVLGAGGYRKTAPLIVISHLFLQQITTGLWEELTFRGFVCEGYRMNGEHTRKKRIIYAFISFAVFGMIHAVDVLAAGGDMGYAASRFLETGVIGLAFAAIYLHSGNLLVPVLLHFVYDIPANIPRYVTEWKENVFLSFMYDWALPAMNVLIAIAAVVYLLKEPDYDMTDIVTNAENTVCP